MVATFSTLARVDEHRAARAAKAAAASPADGAEAARADALHAVFRGMDKDGDGR